MAAHALTAADLMSCSVADLDYRPPSHAPPVQTVKVWTEPPCSQHWRAWRQSKGCVVNAHQSVRWWQESVTWLKSQSSNQTKAHR